MLRVGERGSTDDTLEVRELQFIPFWSFVVLLVYATRRIDCRRSGTPKVERVPWCDGKEHTCFRATEARELARKGYALLKRTRWPFLKRCKNLTRSRRLQLRDLLRYDLRSVRAYFHAQALEGLWRCARPGRPACTSTPGAAWSCAPGPSR